MSALQKATMIANRRNGIIERQLGFGETRRILVRNVTFTIRATDVPDEASRNGILGPLVAYNQSKTGRSDIRPLIIALDDSQGQVIGGLWGRTAYDWLFVELLFVPDSLRGRGIGTDLMKRAEAEALARGCHSAWLDTFEFQARGFYERLGYTCFGELSDYPAGARRYFMKKALRASNT
jgi:GNAT superfamily N-acetyltransferase